MKNSNGMPLGGQSQSSRVCCTSINKNIQLGFCVPWFMTLPSRDASTCRAYLVYIGIPVCECVTKKEREEPVDKDHSKGMVERIKKGRECAVYKEDKMRCYPSRRQKPVSKYPHTQQRRGSHLRPFSSINITPTKRKRDKDGSFLLAARFYCLVVDA